MKNVEIGLKRNIPLRRKSPESPIRTFPMGAFDFETSALDGDVVYGTLQRELGIGGERSKIETVYTASAMLDALIAADQPGMRWYAHNLEFDLLFLLREVSTRQKRGEIGDAKLYERGLGQFFRCDICYGDDQVLQLYDSYALFNSTLAEFAKNFSKIGHKHTIDWDVESFDPWKQSHREYAAQDTAILLDAMVHYDAAVHDIFGVHVRGTFSSTSLRAFESLMPKNSTYHRLSPTQEEFCREGYFGGLCFLTDTNTKSDVDSYDVNSMYPHCMRTYGVPAGRPVATHRIVPGKIGMYRVRVTVPDSHKFGVLGYRDRKGVCWPRGEFTTTAFCFEIERAERLGCSVDIIEGLVWPRVDFIFNDFVDICEKKRAEFKGTSFEIVVKYIQNSLYGKFGTKTEGNEVRIFSDNDLVDLSDWAPYIDPNTGADLIEGCFVRPEERSAAYMQPHWAAYITARARGILLDAFEKYPGKIYYGDTDSLKGDRAALASLGVGPRYGEFKVDGQYATFRALAPKVYVYVDRDNEMDGAAKGVPRKLHTPELWGEIIAGNTPKVMYNSLENLRTALKHGGGRALNRRERTVTTLANSDNWFDSGGGQIKAVKIINEKRTKT